MPSIASSGDAPASSWRRPGVALASILPVAAFLLYALATPGLSRGDSAGVYVTAAALAEGRGFVLDGYLAALAPASASADAAPAAYPHVAYAAGRHYHAAPPGRALLALPLYALGALLAPLLGVETPAILIMLLGPLLGALVVGCVYRWLGAHLPRRLAVAATGGCALLLLPVAVAPSIPIVAAALAAVGGPSVRALLERGGGKRAAVVAGVALGALILVDYLVGGVALVAVALLALALVRRRARGAALALLAAGALPLIVLAAWQTAAFGFPWHLAFRAAIDPAGRSLRALVRPDSVVALTLATVIVGAFAAFSMRPLAPGLRKLPPLFACGVLALGALVGFGAPRDTPVLPVRWWESSALAPLLLGALLLAFAPVAWRRLRAGIPIKALAPVALVCLLVLSPLVALLPRGAQAATATDAENYAAPFAIETGGAVRPLWTIERGEGQIAVSALRLDAGARALGPWIDVWPGAVYGVRAGGDGPLRVTYGWEDAARNSLTTQTASFAPGAARRARFAAPVGAAGLRLRVEALAGTATVADLRLELVGGVRVEPFPGGRRAALAFSFDWESAMGGLIHSRSEGNGEGAGATVGLRADGGPSVAEAAEKGRRMRDGARFLADLFARHDIRATFYSTGYNLLPGNPACARFLGDPTYANANAANGWGSDWWRTHPWYGDDPCATEGEAPAWYFASATRELANAGHEIASHSFGHLYVRGVTPTQLDTDLAQWQRAATALGLPSATGFAFPWTSSNSLDDRFWAVFARQGMTTLTRLYPPDVRHPYELDRVKGAPGLLVFPDYYLASKAEAQAEALARIDTTLAVRGYHSLWNHPNEALEQGGPVIWSGIVEYAAAQRERGLWLAPVGEIAAYGTATREVAVTALPIAGGTRLIVENRSGRAMQGLTLRLPVAASAITIDGRAATAGDRVILPTLAAGERAVVVARR